MKGERTITLLHSIFRNKLHALRPASKPAGSRYVYRLHPFEPPRATQLLALPSAACCRDWEGNENHSLTSSSFILEKHAFDSQVTLCEQLILKNA